MSECQTKAGNLECMNVWMFWTTFVFMSMLKTYSHTFSLSLSLTLTLSHSHTLSISHSITLDMLNKFCFHVYAQKSLFIAENCNAFFWHQWFFFDKTFHLCFFWDHISTLTCEFRSHRAGSQLKIGRSILLPGLTDLEQPTRALKFLKNRYFGEKTGAMG